MVFVIRVRLFIIAVCYNLKTVVFLDFFLEFLVIDNNANLIIWILLICLHYYQINNDQKFQKRIQKHYSFKIITDPYNKKSDPYNCKNESNQLNSYTILGSERLKEVMNLWAYLATTLWRSTIKPTELLAIHGSQTWKSGVPIVLLKVS